MPTKPLVLHVELGNGFLTKARAYAVATEYDALKTVAATENITFSDTAFAKIVLNAKDAGPLSKALDRCKTEPSPGDGKHVAKIEEAIKKYKENLAMLQTDVGMYEAEKAAAKVPWRRR